MSLVVLHALDVHVLEGEFELTDAGETKVLKPGQDAVIPSNIPHSGKALTKCYIIDAFYPVREDYRNAAR
ncbi:MAG: cupin domain-containing protein [Chloroflexota bacterium]|nr:cupin domain-containing protein [Chloroflexota bacterium]